MVALAFCYGRQQASRITVLVSPTTSRQFAQIFFLEGHEWRKKKTRAVPSSSRSAASSRPADAKNGGASMMVQPLNFFTPISCCKDLWTSYFGPVAFSFSCRMQSLWTKLLVSVLRQTYPPCPSTLVRQIHRHKNPSPSFPFRIRRPAPFSTP